MRLHLIRHAAPQAAAGICYGRSDLAVAPEEQARLLPLLAAQLPRGAPIFSSPLLRCASLAHALALAIGSAAPVLDARLMEMNFGTWEMQPWSAIPRAQIDAWAADVVDYRPGGGESVRQAALRVQAFHTALRQLSYADVVLVTHAGSIRLLQACIDTTCASAIARRAAAWPHHIGYGSVHVMEVGRL